MDFVEVVRGRRDAIWEGFVDCRCTDGERLTCCDEESRRGNAHIRQEDKRLTALLLKVEKRAKRALLRRFVVERDY